MKLCAILTFALLIAITIPAVATTHYVDVAGSGDYTEIKPAVNAAVEGDTILIAPGTYTGANNRNMDPNGKNLVIIGDSGGGPVIIDPEFESRAFQYLDGEDATSLLRGVTIVNAAFEQNGGAIGVNASSPTIENCSFIDCEGYSNGGALTFYDSSSSITDCYFRGNSARFRAGAIYAHVSSLTITGCTFDANWFREDPMSGGAIYLNDTPATIENCTIVRNDIEQVSLYGPLTDATISNCIIAGGMAGRPVAVGANATGLVTHCVLYYHPDGNDPECGHTENINLDPGFCNGGVDDYTLCNDSFALPENNMWMELIGAHDLGCGPCGSPVETSSWGRVKALYR